MALSSGPFWGWVGKSAPAGKTPPAPEERSASALGKLLAAKRKAREEEG